ncbi:MAG: GNAT family N-acetyltransferase [Alphaproteobacteria bacterium]|nr:GNAT family N-acetyltransferase [Alphaproteobacteria bacterium]MBQ3117543.1 GNAT family N-acetyltransferase [Alphaproteobacteria bacterium]MBQ6855424.1 GNAT family N-acetyltransferase [Alphaproteobacteria bacterium]MBR3913931.1 GNAT family N-acetyltransferase [Alphaproteobacteria bacterium]
MSIKTDILSSSQSGMSDVIWDKDLLTVPWACAGLGIKPSEIRILTALAFFWQGRLVGSLLFHDGYAGRDVWWTIYTVDKHWCQRRFLRTIFRVAFEDFHFRRIGIIVRADNKKSLSLVRRLGFVEEGRFRQIEDDGTDCLVFSMLKNENQFV